MGWEEEMHEEAIERTKEHIARILDGQLARVERIKCDEDWIDYATLKPIIIGVLGGDGIGPSITAEAQRVLEIMLDEEERLPGREIRGRMWRAPTWL
jgi:isocitrate dehydrogenase (NAD+)